MSSNWERKKEAVNFQLLTGVNVRLSLTAGAVLAVFDMDRIEIVAPRSNGEAVFSGFTEKKAFELKMDKMVTNDGPGMHHGKAPQLSRQWGLPQSKVILPFLLCRSHFGLPDELPLYIFLEPIRPALDVKRGVIKTACLRKQECSRPVVVKMRRNACSETQLPVDL